MEKKKQNGCFVNIEAAFCKKKGYRRDKGLLKMIIILNPFFNIP